MAIELSNGHILDYVVSGVLGFDGLGGPWIRSLVRRGIVDLSQFTIVTETLTEKPFRGHFRWWRPWSYVRLMRGGLADKLGPINPGIDWWRHKVGPFLPSPLPVDEYRQSFVKSRSVAGSIFGNREELVRMAKQLNFYRLVALEIVASRQEWTVREVIDTVTAVRKVSYLPVIVRVCVAQDYLAIAKGLMGVAEAISLGGRSEQSLNWQAVEELAKQGAIPVIAPDIMKYADMAKVRSLGARAVSFGRAIHVWTPWASTSLARREVKENSAKSSMADSEVAV